MDDAELRIRNLCCWFLLGGEYPVQQNCSCGCGQTPQNCPNRPKITG